MRACLVVLVVVGMVSCEKKRSEPEEDPMVAYAREMREARPDDPLAGQGWWCCSECPVGCKRTLKGCEELVASIPEEVPTGPCEKQDHAFCFAVRVADEGRVSCASNFKGCESDQSTLAEMWRKIPDWEMLSGCKMTE